MSLAIYTSTLRTLGELLRRPCPHPSPKMATRTAGKILLPISTIAFSSIARSILLIHLPFPQRPFPFPLRCHYKPIRSVVAITRSTSALVTTSTIVIGDKPPKYTLSYLDATGEFQAVTVSGLTKGKKAIFFAVPGAFTPTCSQKHLPGFVVKAAELRAKGNDTIACISVNDDFVMKAWKENLGIGDEVLLLSDGNVDFTRALGMELDLSDKSVSLGVRSRRNALLAEDGVVKVLNLEEGGAFTTSSAHCHRLLLPLSPPAMGYFSRIRVAF